MNDSRKFKVSTVVCKCEVEIVIIEKGVIHYLTNVKYMSVKDTEREKQESEIYTYFNQGSETLTQPPFGFYRKILESKVKFDSSEILSFGELD